jgi:hypothetical protein
MEKAPTPEEMEEIRQQIEKFQKTEAELLSEVQKITLALVGQPELKRPGLIDDVKANSEYIEKDRRFKAKAVGIIGGLQLIGFFVIDFFKNFKLK